MTSLVSWVGIDQRLPSSIYIASDSRISWQDKSAWDYGRKTFACSRSPDVFGYCGDVLFPSQALGQLVSLIDDGLILSNEMDYETRMEAVFKYLGTSLEQYPIAWRQIFSIIYGTRSSSGMSSKFHAVKFHWDKNWSRDELMIPNRSDLLIALGSGASAVAAAFDEWNRGDASGTSRAVFSAFCDALSTGNDPSSGGPPQLVGLYREYAGMTFGVISGAGAYYNGSAVAASGDLSKVEWRNALFERCDGATLKRLEGAQPQPRPRSQEVVDYR
jgi:hypothetical protein